MQPAAIESSTGTAVQVGGRELLFFGGCNYLGLHHDPAVLGALQAGLARYGLSSAASRETSGHARAHAELERELAEPFGLADSALLPGGYLANIALAQALAGGHRPALVDEGAHPSIHDAARAAGLAVQTYAHADTSAAAERLASLGDDRPVVWTDGFFPAEGRAAPVRELLAALPPGGVLAVDDCHGFGVLGERGLGSCEGLDLADGRLALSVTLSKAYGCQGGAVLASPALLAAVRGSAAYRCSTPIPPALAEAGRAALAVAASEPERRGRLRARVQQARGLLQGLGLPLGETAFPVLAFAPGPPAAMAKLHGELLEAGLWVPYVRYPGGPGEAYFRATVTAEHTPEEVGRLAGELGRRL